MRSPTITGSVPRMSSSSTVSRVSVPLNQSIHTEESTTITGPAGISSSEPSQRSLPRSLRRRPCCRVRTSRRSASSTAAFLVLQPLAVRASAISSSSMSILVRMTASCVRYGNFYTTLAVSDKREHPVIPYVMVGPRLREDRLRPTIHEFFRHGGTTKKRG